MIVELGVGIFAIGAVGYAIYWQRRRAMWAKIREDQLKRLKWLKKKFEGGEEEMKRSKQRKKKIGGK